MGVVSIKPSFGSFVNDGFSTIKPRLSIGDADLGWKVSVVFDVALGLGSGGNGNGGYCDSVDGAGVEISFIGLFWSVLVAWLAAGTGVELAGVPARYGPACEVGCNADWLAG